VARERPEFVVDFPTLFVAADWVPRHCVVPDGFDAGKPFDLVDWQAWCFLNYYRVRPEARVGQLAPAFHYRRSQIVLPQKAGKAPYTSAHICVEGVGPALFAGWAEGGEQWDCRDYGCGCGWVYEYEPGEAMAMPWPTPLIQITATSDDQTDNIYSALRPMIDDGPLSVLIPKTGEEFIRLPNKGRIDTVTSNARSRLGQRVTYAPQDETGIWTKQHGMADVAKTQRRGLAGMGGRAEETTNAWDPSENSVAQATAESRREDIFRFHPLAPQGLDYRDEDERREIHKVVYRGSRWVDLDAIEAEAAELLEDDPANAERFFGNRLVAGADKAFDIDKYKPLRDDSRTIGPGRLVTAGFDGALTFDSTGIVVTDIETGHQMVVGFWPRPPHIPDDEYWEAPVDEVHEAADMVFETWNVWRFGGDPPHWREDLSKMAGRHGEDRVVEWWTNHRKQMGYALRDFKSGMRPGVMSYGGENADALEEHITNAVVAPTTIRHDEDGTFLTLIKKQGPKSKLKIDLAMCAVISWDLRLKAIKAGVLDDNEPDYGSASW
jgi:hypothetical protein